MGQNVSACVFDDCAGSGATPQKIEVQFYKDCNGHVKEFSSNATHKHNEELNFVSALDSFVMKPNDEWYVINVDWLSRWLEFAKGMAPLPPGQISNSDLVDDSKPKKLRSNLAVKRDFRCVCKEVWNFFYEKYGGGPVLYFHVPPGFDDRAYRTGEWMRTASLTDLVKVIIPQTKFIQNEKDSKNDNGTDTDATHEISPSAAETGKESPKKEPTGDKTTSK
eukprot:gene12369-26021_t